MNKARQINSVHEIEMAKKHRLITVDDQVQVSPRPIGRENEHCYQTNIDPEEYQKARGLPIGNRRKCLKNS